MKRSEINAIIRSGIKFVRQYQFHLPPFAFWSPEDWQHKGPEVSEIVQNGLGWDITDFNRGDYSRFGLLLFTIRNGTLAALQNGIGKVYAEKMLIVGVDQITPMHFHWRKTEDIINRGGGTLKIQVFNSTTDENLDRSTDVQVSVDGDKRLYQAGGIVELAPGESITLTPGCYHQFWGAGEQVLVGEVSSVNDDQSDNRFHEPMSRFPQVEEDEAPLHLLVSDYENYYRGGA